MERGNTEDVGDLPDVELETKSVEDRILKPLGLTWEYLEKKRVLDLGAGSGEFAREAASHGIEVISLERFPENHSDIYKEGYVHAAAENIPFEDKSFDLIISHAAPPGITETPEKVDQILLEVSRVLSDDGEFRFGPGNIFTKETADDDGSSDVDARLKRIEENAQRHLRELGWKTESKGGLEDSIDYHSLHKTEVLKHSNQ